MGRLPATRRSTNPPLAGFVMFFVLSRQSSALQQRRQNSESLDAVEDRCEQLLLPSAVEREHRAVTRVEEFIAPGGVDCIAPKKFRQ